MQLQQNGLELNSFLCNSLLLSQISFSAGTWCLLLLLCLVQVSDHLPLSSLRGINSPKGIRDYPYWATDGRSIESHCSFHLIAPGNDCIRTEKKNPHRTPTTHEMMQLVGSSHATPTEINLKATWWDWVSVILTSTTMIVYICYYSFPVKFIQSLFKYTTIILLCSLSPVAKNNSKANRVVGMALLHDKVEWLFLCPSGFQARGICLFVPHQPQ